MSNEICAAIVTYHPGLEFERSVEILRPQVSRLVVVDNHSSEEVVLRLRVLSKAYDFHLVENSDNYGIGKALNQSITWAMAQRGCEFILFFDQDSFISETFVAEMVAEYRKHVENEKVFLVIPSIVHRRTGAAYHERKYHGQYLVAQTSGSLIPIQVFVNEGVYREDLFIDYVDYEFCLRVASKGWGIAFCQQAVLYHEPGNIQQKTYLGMFRITTANYSPLRKYYLMRNGIWTIKQYAPLHLAWALDQTCRILKDALRALLFEENRRATVLAWTKAVRDVLHSRFGALKDV